MDFKDAVKLIEKGKKVRRIGWGNNLSYIYMNNFPFINVSQGNDLGYYDYLANDWEEYIKPKKTLWDKKTSVINGHANGYKEDDVKEVLKELICRYMGIESSSLFMKDMKEIFGEELLK